MRSKLIKYSALSLCLCLSSVHHVHGDEVKPAVAPKVKPEAKPAKKEKATPVAEFTTRLPIGLMQQTSVFAKSALMPVSSCALDFGDQGLKLDLELGKSLLFSNQYGCQSPGLHTRAKGTAGSFLIGASSMFALHTGLSAYDAVTRDHHTDAYISSCYVSLASSLEFRQPQEKFALKFNGAITVAQHDIFGNEAQAKKSKKEKENTENNTTPSTEEATASSSYYTGACTSEVLISFPVYKLGEHAVLTPFSGLSSNCAFLIPSSVVDGSLHLQDGLSSFGSPDKALIEGYLPLGLTYRYRHQAEFPSVLKASVVYSPRIVGHCIDLNSAEDIKECSSSPHNVSVRLNTETRVYVLQCNLDYRLDISPSSCNQAVFSSLKLAF